MVARAKKEILHMSIPYDSTFFDAARKAAGGRVKVRALTSIDAGSLASVEELLQDPSCSVRHAGAGAGGGINVALVDGDEVLLTPPSSSSSPPQGAGEAAAAAAVAAAGQSAIWSGLHDYVEHYRSMFDSVWASSAAQERIAQVEGQARLAELASTLRRALRSHGFAVKDTLRGASGLAHSFALVAEGRGGKTIVADIVGPEKSDDDLQTLLIGFVIKCMDIRADHKVLITASEPGEMAAQARALHGGITVVVAADAAKTLARLAGTAAAPAAATTG